MEGKCGIVALLLCCKLAQAPVLPADLRLRVAELATVKDARGHTALFLASWCRAPMRLADQPSCPAPGDE